MREVALCVLMLTAGLAGCIGQGEQIEQTAGDPAGANASDASSDPDGAAGTNGTDEASSASNTTGSDADDTAGGSNATTSRPGASDERPDVVMAFIDLGINPYHEDFRAEDDRADEHPSSYLEDYPEDAKALNLTFDHASLEDAIEADCEAWESVEADTLYYVPGTRVVGMTYKVGEVPEFRCENAGEDRPAFIENGWHGTMVASRGAGNAYGACEACLVVSVRGFSPETPTWAADASWIDVQSNSWGPLLCAVIVVPACASAGAFWAEDLETAAQKQPAFWASMNGLLYHYGFAGHPTQAETHLGPSMIRVGGQDSGQVSAWHGSSPHIVSDACWSWAAEHDSLDKRTPRTGGGTSGATPFAAGIASQILLEAREILDHPGTGVDDGVLAQGEAAGIESGPLADGEFTMDELERVLFTTADPRPERVEEDGTACEVGDYPWPGWWALPVDWRDVPEGPAGIPLIGYGAATPYTAEHAVDVLHGDQPMPERATEDLYFEIDRTYREIVHEAIATPSSDAPTVPGSRMVTDASSEDAAPVLWETGTFDDALQDAPSELEDVLHQRLEDVWAPWLEEAWTASDRTSAYDRDSGASGS